MTRIFWFVLLIAFSSTGSTSAKILDISGTEPYPALYEPDDAGAPPEGPGLVLLGTDLVEIAVALGAADHILARPADIDLPGIEDTPHKVREWAGVEGVLAFKPRIVIGSSVINQRLLDGVKVVGIRADLIDRTLPATEKVARLAMLMGLQDRGARLIEAIEADYASVRPVTVDGRPLRIVHASKMGAGTSFTAGGAETAVHNLILRVGAHNATAEIGRDRYRPVTPEGMIIMAPDVVLIAESELPAFGDIDGLWADYPGIGLTPAGRARNIIIMRDLHVRADAASSGIASRALSQALNEMFK